jgi:uncharacterized protein YndB with AHSA1/START domain
MYKDYATTVSIDAPAERVYAAINDPRSWWGEGIDGRMTSVGDTFIHEVVPVHRAKLEVTELIPNEKVVWRVLENQMDFVEDQSEWVGTTITFDLTPTDRGTEVHFEHKGLTPAYECYQVCSNAWAMLMHESLPRLIGSGVGSPYAHDFDPNRHEALLN